MANEVLFWHGEKTAALAAGRVMTMENVQGARAAVGVLTSDATQPADGATVTIGTKVYTFQTVLTNVDGNVLIGVSVTATLLNLKNAINLGAGTPGTDYATLMTAHPDVAATASDATTVSLAAEVAGAEGNAIATTETSTHLSFGAATLTTGVTADPIADFVTKFPKYETYALVTQVGANTDYALPAGDEGQETTLYLKTKGAGSSAVITGAFVGGTTLTFDTAGETAKLKFLNASWAPIYNTGALT